MSKETQRKKVSVQQTIATFILFIAYATLMDFLHYKFLDWHPEILGYHYHEKCLILPTLILFLFSSRVFIIKSLFFKKLNRAANIAIWIVLAALFVFYSWCAFDSAYLTEDGVKTHHAEFSSEAFASAKIGIKKTRSNSDQYIEIGLIREKYSLTFNTFQTDYTIADFYNTCNGKLFLDGIKEIPVEIEIFGAENLNGYLDGNRLITKSAASRLRNFFSERFDGSE